MQESFPLTLPSPYGEDHEGCINLLIVKPSKYVLPRPQIYYETICMRYGYQSFTTPTIYVQSAICAVGRKQSEVTIFPFLESEAATPVAAEAVKRCGAQFGADGRPVAKRPRAKPKAVRGWVREGVFPSRNGVRGYYPRENFDICDARMRILECRIGIVYGDDNMTVIGFVGEAI